jgi:hypothetical protein
MHNFIVSLYFLTLSLSLYVIQDDDDYLDMYTRLLLFKRERKNKICF